MPDAPPPNPYTSDSTAPSPTAPSSAEPSSAEPSPTAPSSAEPSSATMTAPGAPIAIPQEQLDRFAQLMTRVTELGGYVVQNRAQLPAELVSRWDAWHQGLVQVLLRARTDQIAQRQVLGQLPDLEASLERYRAAFAERGGPRVPSGSSTAAPERSRFSPLLAGGVGLALGLLGGFVVFAGGGAER